MEHPGEYGNPMEDEESDEEENSTARNGRGIFQKEFEHNI
jgi:hypothetical protein